MFYLLGLALPYVHFMFLIWVVFEIFTPIMGRSGTEIPPEVVLASLVTLATVLLSSFFVSVPPKPRLLLCGGWEWIYNHGSVLATFHLLGPEHKVDPGRSGHGLPPHVPGDFQRASVSLLRQSGAAAAQASLSAGVSPQKLHVSASLRVQEVKGATVLYRPAAAHHSDLPQPSGPSGKQGLGPVDQQLRLHGDTAHHPPHP